MILQGWEIVIIFNCLWSAGADNLWLALPVLLLPVIVDCLLMSLLVIMRLYC